MLLLSKFWMKQYSFCLFLQLRLMLDFAVAMNEKKNCVLIYISLFSSINSCLGDVNCKVVQTQIKKSSEL